MPGAEKKDVAGPRAQRPSRWPCNRGPRPR
jgi:hypothetical protein